MPPRYHRLQLLKASQHLQPDFEAKKRTYLCWSKKMSPSDNKMESPNKKKLLQVHSHVEFPHSTSSVRGPAPIQLFLLVARVKHFQITRSSVQAWTERWTLRFPSLQTKYCMHMYIYLHLHICVQYSLLHKLSMDTKSLWFWKRLFLWKQFRWSTGVQHLCEFLFPGVYPWTTNPGKWKERHWGSVKLSKDKLERLASKEAWSKILATSG